jgi:hypothetical protein
MRGDHHEGTQAPLLGKMLASRAELLALLEALHAFFSPAGEEEPHAQGVEECLCQAIEEGLQQAANQQAPVVLELSKDELVMLTIAAGTMTAPYRAGMPISPAEECSSAVLSPLVERLLPLVRQIRLDELQAMRPAREQA